MVSRVDAEQALQQFQKSLVLREQLYKSNPKSAQAARDVVVSNYKLAMHAMQIEDQENALKYLTVCYEILHGLGTADRP